MKKDCLPAKLKAYKGLKEPTCECAACWKKYAIILMKTKPEIYLFKCRSLPRIPSSAFQSVGLRIGKNFSGRRPDGYQYPDRLKK